MAKNNRFRGLRALASVLANATAILSANFIVFYILDHYNPGLHFIIYSTFPLTQYLHWVVASLAVLTGLLYLLLFTMGAFQTHTFSGKRLALILVIDILVAGAFAMTVNTYAFDWLGLRAVDKNNLVAIATPTPIPTVAPTEIPTPQPTAAPAAEQSGATPAPTEVPTATPEPTATPIPGLLGNKYAEKFTDGEPVITEPNTKETLADGTERTLVYTYASNKIAVDIYHYQKDRLEYQIADLYLRDIKSLQADYATTAGNVKKTTEFARAMNAILAVNSDYYLNNASNEGLVIRNGYLMRSNPCLHSDLCVIFQDGTMRCYECKTETINNDEIMAQYPYHSFYFGPSLLDKDGKAKTSFASPQNVNGRNPRTAIGYYEPGHYAFLCILGTRSMYSITNRPLGDGKSPGMSMEEMSQLCESLGMQAAYNFDGGGSSAMYWNETVFGHNSRTTSDVLAVVEIP